MESDKWQVSYIVAGLPAPEKVLVCSEDVALKRSAKPNEAIVSIKIDENESKEGFPKEGVLNGIIQLLTLETNLYPRIMYESTILKSPICEELPFGERGIPHIPLQVKYKPEQYKKLISAFKKAVSEYKTLQKTFEASNRRFIRRAIEFYHSALGEAGEKRLLYLFIALEYLFSKDIDELRYRLALRVFGFLGCVVRDKKQIFETVHDLYKTRSKIVHGAKKVTIDEEKIMFFEEILRICCRIFLYLDTDKDEIIKKLDLSLIDEEEKKSLCKIVADAFIQWRKSEYRESIDLPRPTKVKISVNFIPDKKRT